MKALYQALVAGVVYLVAVPVAAQGRVGQSICGESPNTPIAVTWRSSTGNWWAHGPTQSLSLVDKNNEGEALAAVIPTHDVVGWDTWSSWGRSDSERLAYAALHWGNRRPNCTAVYSIRARFGMHSREAGDNRVNVYVLSSTADPVTYSTWDGDPRRRMR